MFVVFAGKKQPKNVGKMPEIKKIQVRSDADIFSKMSAKCTNFDVSSFGRELQVSSLGVFDEVLLSVSSRNFNQVSVSKVTVSTTSLSVVKKLF